jgi:hypothetical protein
MSSQEMLKAKKMSVTESSLKTEAPDSMLVEDPVVVAGNELGLELEPIQLAAIRGMLDGLPPEDDQEAELRFDIIQARYRLQAGKHVTTEQLALHSIFRTLARPDR